MACSSARKALRLCPSPNVPEVGVSGNVYSLVPLDETALICISLEAGNDDCFEDSQVLNENEN